MKYLIALFLAATFAAPAAAQRSEPEQIGAFYLSVRTDPITDEVRGVLMVPANEAAEGEMIAVGWACTDEGVEVAFSMGRHLGREETTVQVRFDQEPASQPEPWSPGNDQRFVFLPDEQLVDFTRRAMAANRLALRARDSRGNEYTYTFSLMGLTRGLRRLPCAEGLFDGE